MEYIYGFRRHSNFSRKPRRKRALLEEFRSRRKTNSRISTVFGRAAKWMTHDSHAIYMGPLNLKTKVRFIEGQLRSASSIAWQAGKMMLFYEKLYICRTGIRKLQNRCLTLQWPGHSPNLMFEPLLKVLTYSPTFSFVWNNTDQPKVLLP